MYVEAFIKNFFSRVDFQIVAGSRTVTQVNCSLN